MPRPVRCYKTALYSWSVEAVNWATSLLRPDATGQLEHFRALISITTGSPWKSHVHSEDVFFVYCNMWPLPVHTGDFMNA